MTDQSASGDPQQSQPGDDPSMGDAGGTGSGGTGDADLSQPAGDPQMGGDDVTAPDPREGREGGA